MSECSNSYKYLALASLVKDYAAQNWLKTNKQYAETSEKQVYYFSMEFLIGRLLQSNLINLGIRDLCEEALKELNINLRELEETEVDAGLGNGGLGRLAACFLDSMASLELPGHGNGIRYNYGLFEQMKTKGCVLSEYGSDSKPEPWHFPMRNRLISGLADGVFVIEARERSGSLITVDMGLEQGKNIYALPGHFQTSLSKGCHQLIQCGAKLVYEPKDILEDLPVLSVGNDSKEKKLSLDKSEQLVYASLSLGPKDIDTIAMSCGLPLSETISVLMKMELEGKIRAVGQNHYMLKL